MTVKKEIHEMTSEALRIILKVLIDAIIVLAVSIIAFGLKFILENYIYNCKIENIDNKCILIVYNISKVLVISLFAIYVIFDIVSEILRLTKNIKIVYEVKK
jgi:hypothetical protein